MANVAAIILAAGRGTRMKSSVPKALQTLLSRPLLSFVIKALEDAGVSKKVLVVGYKSEAVKSAFRALPAVTQKRLLGSGDAVKSAKKLFSRFNGTILILYGDTPLISSETIKKLIKKHKKTRASATILTANVADPSGYGRILKDAKGNVREIMEDKDLTPGQRHINAINAGCYCFNKKDLFYALEKLKMNAKKKEYYLTDAIGILRRSGKAITSVLSGDPREAFGVDSKSDLAKTGSIMQKKITESLMAKGVTVVHPGSAFIDRDAKIAGDTVIYPNTVIERGVIVGRNCKIGPFARLRAGTVIGDNVEIGNFVELVRTKVSSGTKIKHLTYLGDARVGRNVNIGAGTITANYDGKNKNKTVIGDAALIGVRAVLVAPVRIGKNAVVGAGSVVTKGKNVPPGKTVVGVPARLLKRGRKK